MMKLHYNHPSYTAADQRFLPIDSEDARSSIWSMLPETSQKHFQASAGEGPIAAFCRFGKIAPSRMRDCFCSPPRTAKTESALNEFWTPERISGWKFCLQSVARPTIQPGSLSALSDQLEQPATPIDLSHPDRWLDGCWMTGWFSRTALPLSPPGCAFRNATSRCVSATGSGDHTGSIDIPNLSRSFISSFG